TVLEAVFHVVPLVEDCTTYAVTAAPPSSTGADQETVTAALPGVTVTRCGADATVRGVTSTTDEGAERPTTFSAPARAWYTPPLTSDAIVADVAPGARPAPAPQVAHASSDTSTR